jgi:2,3-dihydroxyphenylpropionate 1,2-dioxygenase
MPLVAALAASHAPNILLEPGAEWDDFMRLHYRMAPQAAASKPSVEAQRALRRQVDGAFAALKADLDAALPDVLVVVANDQFVNFFYDNLPTFFVSLGEEHEGRFVRHRFRYRGHPELGRAILAGGLEAEIDFAFGEDVELEHTQTVPLYFLAPPGSALAVLPVFVNTWIEPLPTPRRCSRVGEVIRQVVDRRPERVAMLATGGLSHFPGSPRIGEIDTGFDAKLLEMLREGQGRTLASWSLAELQQAGDSEFLNWMVVLGAVGDARALRTFYHPDGVATGLGFASWRLA